MSTDRERQPGLERKYVRLGLEIGLCYVALLIAFGVVVTVVTGAPVAVPVITAVVALFFGLLGVWLGYKVLPVIGAK